MLKRIITLYYLIVLPLTPASSWKKAWRRRRRDFILNNDHIKANCKAFKERYRAEGYDINSFKRFKRDFLLCFILFSMTSDEYFQYRFMDKGWKWRNHHVTVERRKFIDTVINDSESVGVLANKADFNRYYSKYIHRKWCDIKTVSEEEFISMFADCKRVILKPRGSYGGTGIKAFDTDPQTLADVYKDYTSRKWNFVVEEYLNQTGILHDINPASLNSIRITTIRGKNGVTILDGFYRCGCGDSVVDNFSSGGIIFPYDVDTGEIYDGHSKSDLNVSTHPISKIKVKGMRLPDYELIVKTIKEVHDMSPAGVDIVGWDVCVIDGEVVLIEGNSKPGYTALYNPENCLWQKIKSNF